MNLVIDGLPALALAVELVAPNVMRCLSHTPSENIFAHGLKIDMLRIGIVWSIIASTLMVWSYHYTVTTYGPSDKRWKTIV